MNVSVPELANLVNNTISETAFLFFIISLYL
ncbi:hypothetical protein NSB1T_02395 [Coprobacter fastidiosus NSB1 = JCM 33896]|nr:hypothetical protein NSB1T_02395 [Coprobacter fastidiosus NSB1 = JCM 33896]